MLNFRNCCETYDALDEALAIAMREALAHGDVGGHWKLLMRRARFISDRLALLKEYESEQRAKNAEAARKRAVKKE
jgi:hypothetical protein